MHVNVYVQVCVILCATTIIWFKMDVRIRSGYVPLQVAGGGRRGFGGRRQINLVVAGV